MIVRVFNIVWNDQKGGPRVIQLDTRDQEIAECRDGNRGQSGRAGRWMGASRPSLLQLRLKNRRGGGHGPPDRRVGLANRGLDSGRASVVLAADVFFFFFSRPGGDQYDREDLLVPDPDDPGRDED